MTRFFDHNESAGNALEDVTIAVIGYGSQGRAQALNLRDSGLRVHQDFDPTAPVGTRRRPMGGPLLMCRKR